MYYDLLRFSLCLTICSFIRTFLPPHNNQYYQNISISNSSLLYRKTCALTYKSFSFVSMVKPYNPITMGLVYTRLKRLGHFKQSPSWSIMESNVMEVTCVYLYQVLKITCNPQWITRLYMACGTWSFEQVHS